MTKTQIINRLREMKRYDIKAEHASWFSEKINLLERESDEGGYVRAVDILQLILDLEDSLGQ